jgi:hypothetical protein
MIFCCLIADLGCSKFPTRLKGEGTKKSCEFFLLLGEWGRTTQERERERERERESVCVCVCVIQGTASSSEGVHPFMIELMGAAASLHTRYSSMS